jgi:phage FluMu protein gp41
MYARAAIVSFEEKKRPPHLSELLSLNRADREAVIEGYMEFLSQSIGDRASEKLDADTLRLAIGLEEGSETFDLVTLCDKASLLTGYEEQKIEREAAGEYEQTCILLGYDIASLSQSEGSGSIEGPLSLDRIKRLDAFDLNFMMGAVGERRRLFRRTREAVPSDVRNGSGPDSD